MEGEDGCEERWFVAGRVLVSIERVVFAEAREHDQVGVGEDGGFICGGPCYSFLLIFYYFLIPRA